MNIKFIKIISAIVIGIISNFVISCTEVEPGADAKSTILIYAVATNSLSGNLIADKNEMLQAAQKINLKQNNVLVFQAVYEYDENYNKTGNGTASLLKLVKTSDGYGWQTIKDYSYEEAPLNPSRISNVIDYALKSYPANSYGLVFWSHSTASDPYFPTKASESTVELPNKYSFGQDLTVGSGNKYYQLNIDDLAQAIPDNLFKFIWFDSCYMSNIETIYQLRNKCDYFIGYPTEVLDDGMPYQYTLPILASENPDVIAAASRFFDYYENEYRYHIATIAVVDMSQINSLMEYCKNIYNGNSETPVVYSMHKYTNNRQSSGPFYDLGDYTKAIALLKDRNITNDEWENVLSQSVIYKNATRYDFNGVEIPQERYSGISTYVYKLGTTNEKEEFYESLDWFKSVYN